MTPSGLAAIQEAIAELRDPLTPDAQAEQLADETPAILWVDGSPHGGEESGADASLKVLYDLAARTDCAAEQILDEAIVLIVPILNPDGRELDQRRNVNGFDMNRDWFAPTQPEIDGVIEFMRQYPPQLAIDAHEMGTYTYFFPPNADPVYHEIPDQAIHWINDLYGPAMAAEFDRQKIPYFNFRTYDFFGVLYGDTVPAEGFHAAGMTFEKHNGDPIEQRVHEHYTTIWTCLSQAAFNKDDIVSEWHDSWVDAYHEGVDGVLEPNAVYERNHKLFQQVPDTRVRHYFLRTDDPEHAGEAQRLVRRLQRMDVDVYQLTAPLEVPDFKPYFRPREATTFAGRHLLDPDGPGTEAVDPGDAARGPLHRLQHYVRRLGLEQPAAHERPRRLVGAGADPASRGPVAAAGAAGAAPAGRGPERGHLRIREQHVLIRVGRVAALALHAALEPAVDHGHPRPTLRRARSRASMSSSFRTCTCRPSTRCSARPASERSSTG